MRNIRSSQCRRMRQSTSMVEEHVKYVIDMEELNRFLLAQGSNEDNEQENTTYRFNISHDSSYADALHEIQNGKKTGHWIWYIFPQLKGLGHSYRSHFYGINDAAEAKAYLAHPILGKRLREITSVLLALPPEKTARQILGIIDAKKVKSCMTLFYLVSKDELFIKVLERYYDGQLDERTKVLLANQQFLRYGK